MSVNSVARGKSVSTCRRALRAIAAGRSESPRRAMSSVSFRCRGFERACNEIESASIAHVAAKEGEPEHDVPAWQRRVAQRIQAGTGYRQPQAQGRHAAFGRTQRVKSVVRLEVTQRHLALLRNLWMRRRSCPRRESAGDAVAVIAPLRRCSMGSATLLDLPIQQERLAAHPLWGESAARIRSHASTTVSIAPSETQMGRERPPTSSRSRLLGAILMTTA